MPFAPTVNKGIRGHFLCPKPLLFLVSFFCLHCRLGSADVTLCQSPIVIPVHVPQDQVYYSQCVLSQSCAGLSKKLVLFSAD